MFPFKNILVKIDVSEDQQPVLDRAVGLAVKHQAALTIVDVVPEMAWMQRMILPHGMERVPELLARDKAERLREITARVRKRGVAAKSRVLVGRASVEVTRQVLRGKHDLVVKAMKGAHSRQSGPVGSTGKALLQICPCAVLLVKPENAAPFHRVLAAVAAAPDDDDHAQLNLKILDVAHDFCIEESASLDVVSAWYVPGDPYLQSYMQTHEMDALEASIQAECRRNLDQLMSRLGTSFERKSHLERGLAKEVIGKFVREEQVDLIVAGTVARSGIAGMLLGNTIELLVSQLDCAILAIKPAGFVSPVKLRDRNKPRAAVASVPR